MKKIFLFTSSIFSICTLAMEEQQTPQAYSFFVAIDNTRKATIAKDGTYKIPVIFSEGAHKVCAPPQYLSFSIIKKLAEKEPTRTYLSTKLSTKFGSKEIHLYPAQYVNSKNSIHTKFSEALNKALLLNSFD